MLRGPARDAAALYILGDLFEYWAGDDDADTAFNRTVGGALAEHAGRGHAVFFVAGNRDFLLGERFARQCGVSCLPDPVVQTLDGHKILLAHGDLWCTDDVAYQQFRQMVRNPAWQQAFLARPLAERKQIIEGLRRQSEAAKGDKAAEIMDVNPGAIAAAFRTHGVDTLIHGHTHRPGRHEYDLDGHLRTRWVLGDWQDDAPYLVLEDGVLSARRFTL